MNPFEDDNEETQDTKESVINIWVETNGRKKNTYITGWNIPETELKEHIKNIKKSNGCNGTIKQDDSNNRRTFTMQLQGDHVDYVQAYLVKKGVEQNNIHIKG